MTKTQLKIYKIVIKSATLISVAKAQLKKIKVINLATLKSMTSIQ